VQSDDNLPELLVDQKPEKRSQKTRKTVFFPFFLIPFTATARAAQEKLLPWQTTLSVGQE